MSAVLKDLNSAWHEGEVALQRHAGIAERMAEVGGRVMRDHLIDQHRAFFPLLPFVVLGAIDAEGDAWATLRAGMPGFLHAPDPHRLHADLPRDPDDPADAGMEDGNSIALLGIDLKTRRRNRLNGRIVRKGATGFDITVAQSFGNCPQYIQQREYAFVRNSRSVSSPAPQHLNALDDRARAGIGGADTFFVASYADIEDKGRQVDVSHRGGRTGFVRVDADGTLTIPDFAGNLFFNTLGNILVNGKTGLVFPDFSTGDLLQLTGDAEIILDSPEISAFEGAQRLWRFKPRRIVYRADALPLRWSFRAWSPHALLTGSWEDVPGKPTEARP
jgi:predicted pyridoxine 5'-phosphate oxidase superfamily flavin-nucleotide-binding protein